jgi:hypothetical protein
MDDDAAWMGLCDDELQDALRASVEQMTDLERFRAEQAHDEKRALAEAIRLSRDLAPLESMNVVPDDDGRADYVAELMTDLELNPAAREFGDRRLAGMSLGEIRHDLTSYQRRDENRRLAACAARDELEARLLRDVTTAAQQEAALRAVVRPKPAPAPEPAPEPAPKPAPVARRAPPAKRRAPAEQTLKPPPLPVPVDRAVAQLCRSFTCSALQTMARGLGLPVDGPKRAVAERIARWQR